MSETMRHKEWGGRVYVGAWSTGTVGMNEIIWEEGPGWRRWVRRAVEGGDLGAVEEPQELEAVEEPQALEAVEEGVHDVEGHRPAA